MYYICPATGHVVHPRGLDEASPPPFCGRHGVKLFTDCHTCGNPWDVVATGYSTRPTDGVGFCRYCGTPAPWLNRTDLVTWVRHQVQASEDITDAARAELVAVLDRIRDIDPSDGRAIPAWKLLHELAPKLYGATKPVRNALMAENVNKALEAYFGSE
jgi:hypothetical protein